MTNRHLFECGQEREREAVKVALSLSFISQPLWSALGLNPFSSWFALEVKTQWLIGKEAEAQIPGDIDIIAGPLNVTSDRCVMWPPSFEYLVGIEARACVWKQPGRPYNFQGEKERYRNKAQGLSSLGFDRSMLLHLITTEPNSTSNYNPYWVSLNETTDATEELFNNSFSSREDTFYEAVWTLGSVAFKVERDSGTGGPHIIHSPCLINTPTARQKELRLRIATKLNSAFLKLPPPLADYLPLILRKETRGNRLIIEHV